MPKVKVGDINMYYEIHGEGEPLVLICGFGGTSESIKQLMPIPSLSREYRVVVFDNRGAGRSDAPDIPYTLATMADDLAGLLNIIGIDAAHVYGGSMGGMIAQHFALRHPGMVISLILICSHCGGAHRIPADPEYTRLANDPEILKLSQLERNKIMLPFLANMELMKNSPEKMQQLIAEIRKVKYPTPPQGFIQQRQAINAHDTYDRLPEIKAPTLIINGDADRVVPVENARILALRIPGAELVILKNTGHMLLEAADELNRTIMDFLYRHSTKRA